MIRKTIKRNDGMRWMTKALNCCQMVSLGEKASAANTLTKRIASMYANNPR